MHAFSIKEAFAFAWNTFKKEPWLYGGVALCSLIVSLIVNTITRDMDGLIGFIVSVAGVLIQWWLYLGFARMALSAYRGQPVSFKMLYGEKWEVLYRYTLAMILTGIIVVVGLVLLIVPGIIASLMLSMVIFTVLEKGMKPVDSLKESRRLTDGHKWSLFVFMLVAIVINLIGAIPFGLGLLVTIPLTLLALVFVYKNLDQRVQMEPVAKAMPAATPAPAPAPSAPAQM